METSINKGGRPPVPPEKKLIAKSIRLTGGQWAKIDKAGATWLRDLIDATPVPKKKPPEGGLKN